MKHIYIYVNSSEIVLKTTIVCYVKWYTIILFVFENKIDFLEKKCFSNKMNLNCHITVDVLLVHSTLTLSGIHIILVVGYGWSKVLRQIKSDVSSSRLTIWTYQQPTWTWIHWVSLKTRSVIKSLAKMSFASFYLWLWLIYIHRFQSHSCSCQLRLESEYDSVQCEKFYIVKCNHLVCSPNWNLNPGNLIAVSEISASPRDYGKNITCAYVQVDNGKTYFVVRYH